jgi:hypothetical protein
MSLLTARARPRDEAPRARPVAAWPRIAAWFAAVHPARWLRWLRNGMLVMAVVAWLLGGLVIREARHDVATATGNGTQAIAQIHAASKALTSDVDATRDFGQDGVALTGAGSDYTDDLTAANQELITALTDNVAGPQVADGLEFDESQLTTYSDQVQQAVTDFVTSGEGKLAQAEIGSYIPTFEGAIQGDLGSYRTSEQKAVTADLNSQWLGPGDVWWLLLAPFFVMLLLAAGTSYVLWHGFRRLLSGRLIAAVTATLGLVILVASLNVHDGGQAKAFVATHETTLPTPPATDVSFAVSWPALTAWVVLALAVLLLVYSACRPRLDEYRYRP